MQNDIHFIAGLPRSGSTLLAALLRQNPRFHAGMTSPVGSLFNAMLTTTSHRNEMAVFINDTHRERLLRCCFEAYYADIHPSRVVFDTNRQWAAKLPALVKLFPHAAIICCVRNPARILDSIENLVRQNAFSLSAIFNFDASGTVYSRVEGLAQGGGMVGYALHALREAVFGPHADRLLLVRYETLVDRPQETLRTIYDTIGEPYFDHDPEHIEPCHDMVEFDRTLGTPGLHHVRSAVRENQRPMILPPDLFARYERDAFWEDPARLPTKIRIVS